MDMAVGVSEAERAETLTVIEQDADALTVVDTADSLVCFLSTLQHGPVL